MNRLLTSVCLVLGAASVQAQTAFTTRDSVDINNINAMVLVHGDMWWNPTPGIQQPHCFFPNGTTKSISSAGAIWMSASDSGGQLHTAAQTYRQNGNDFWPGPLESDTLTYAESQKWAKIWKVNRSDIYAFLSLTTRDSATVPGAIWTWPAKGNIYARGAGNAVLTINTDMAPFVDINGNGIYEPALGEYPDVKGDQALWWVFSDNGPTHNESHGLPLGVEVHAMAYAYHRGSLIDNVVYYEYKVHNKSANSYANFRIGQMADVDLGDYSDDYIGFDSTRAVGYVYNGHTADMQYGNSIPMAGVMMLAVHSDTATVGSGSFMYYNNDYSLIGNPSVTPDFYNYMRSKTRDGQHIANDMTGPGSTSHGYGSGPWVNFLYTGNPAVSTGWSECAANNLPGDRRMIIASGDLKLTAGSSMTLVMAQVVTNPDTTHACGDGHFGINDLLTVADTARLVYGLGTLPEAVPTVAHLQQLTVYPNPAHDRLVIDNATHNITAGNGVVVYNAMGQKMMVPVTAHNGKYEADISTLLPGSYFVHYSDGYTGGSTTFLKQ